MVQFWIADRPCNSEMDQEGKQIGESVKIAHQQTTAGEYLLAKLRMVLNNNSIRFTVLPNIKYTLSTAHPKF